MGQEENHLPDKEGNGNFETVWVEIMTNNIIKQIFEKWYWSLMVLYQDVQQIINTRKDRREFYKEMNRIRSK